MADETYYFYDALGRQVGMVGVDPDGAGPNPRAASKTQYDNDGHVKEVDSGTVPTSVYTSGTAPGRNGQAYADWSSSFSIQTSDTNQFDGNGMPTIAYHYDAGTLTHVTQRSYDNMLRLDCEAQRLNTTAFGSLPASACTLGTAGVDGYDRIVKNNYDAVTGILTSTTSAYGTSVARTDALKVYDTTGATSTGNLLYVEDANGNRTSYSYDAFNRLIQTCYPLAGTAHASSTTDCEQTAYRTSSVYGATQAGTLVNAVNLRSGSPTITFGYDALGRVSAKAGAVVEGFTYDNFSHILTHTNNTTGGAAATETYTYNALGQLLTDAQPMGTVGYSYDAYGRRSQLTYPGSGLFVTYAYDADDDLTGIYENGTTALLAGFDYDDHGRRAHLYRGNSQTTTYAYDNSNASHLTSITHPANTLSFTYNSADQVKTTTYSNSSFVNMPVVTSANYGINGLNQIATVNSSTAFSYDLRGNQTSDGAVTYAYNANNLMTSAGSNSLAYDAENRLLSYTANGVTTKFLYDDTDLIAEFDGSGNLLRRYVHGPGDNEPLVWYEGAGTGTRRYLMADNLGSITGVTDSSGTQLSINTYDGYGVPSTSSAGYNPTYAGRFRYTGQMWLQELSLYNYKARMYAPTLGRFMQTDPIGYGDGINWYNYVHGDPVNGTDPSGLDGQCPAGQTCAPAKEDITTVIINAFKNEYEKTNQAFNNSENAVYHWEYGADGNSGWRTPVDEALDKAGSFVQPCLDDVFCLGEIGGTLKVETKAATTTEEGVAFVAKGACFGAGTKIATPTGLKNIENIKVGDLVLSYDVDTGQTLVKPVTELVRNPPQVTFVVKLENGLGVVDAIRVTSEHPWLLATHQWESTKDLHAGELVETAQGEKLKVISVVSTGKIEPIYNFTVADTHTYLVGKNHAVVHNTCFNGALNKAVKWLVERGFKAETQTISKMRLDPNIGQAIGMMSEDGKIGFRIEWTPTQGAHINVWSGKESTHFMFDASQQTVNQIVKMFQ